MSSLWSMTPTTHERLHTAAQACLCRVSPLDCAVHWPKARIRRLLKEEFGDLLPKEKPGPQAVRLFTGEHLKVGDVWTWTRYGFPFRLVAFRTESKDEGGRPMPMIVYQNVAGPAALRVVESRVVDMGGRIQQLPTAEWTDEIHSNIWKITTETKVVDDPSA